MADKTNAKAAKSDRTNKDKAAKKKGPGFFKGVARYFRDLKSEMKKIVWPTRKQVVNNTLVVICVCLVVGLFIWGLDFGLAKIVELLLSNA